MPRQRGKFTFIKTTNLWILIASVFIASVAADLSLSFDATTSDASDDPASMTTEQNSLTGQIFHEAPVSAGSARGSRSCWIGREVSASFDRPTSPFSRAFVTVCPSLRIQCRGRVASWRTTLTVADRNPINFAIFRSTHDASGQRFMMVGYNTFTASALGRVVYEVPESKRLEVQPGDIFGYFRMGTGQNEFIGFVNVGNTGDDSAASPSSGSDNHQRSPVLTGSYDSCYQLAMTYIDLIKANYKITIDTNAVLMRRLYSLAAVIESTGGGGGGSLAPSKSAGSFTSIPRNYLPRGVYSGAGQSSNAALLLRTRQRTKTSSRTMAGRLTVEVQNAPPKPVAPVQRWRQYVTTTTTTPPPTSTTTEATSTEPSTQAISTESPFRASFLTYPDDPNYRTNNNDFISEPQSDPVPTTVFMQNGSASVARNRNRSRSNRTRNGHMARAAVSGDNGLAWCGDPPSIDNAYSVNDVVTNIRLPARVYTCNNGYTPVGYNRIYCDPSNQKWTPVNFQCVFTIVVGESATQTIPVFRRTVPANGAVSASPLQPWQMPGASQAGQPSSSSCLFPPVMDNGYAIRQDEYTVVYRCYPGFLKIGQVDQDSSSCDRAKNAWSAPKISCVYGRNTVTIPLNTQPTQSDAGRLAEILVMPTLVTATPAAPKPFIPFATVTIPMENMIPRMTPPPIREQPIYIPPPQPIQQPQLYIQPILPPQAQITPAPLQTAPPFQTPLVPGPQVSAVLDCGLPPRIANGRFYQDQDPVYPAKSFIYECYPGYVMRGQPVVFCNPYYGRFTQLTARCDPVGLEATQFPTTSPKPSTESPLDCGTPPPIPNAFTVTGGRSSTAIYLCIPGYAGVGSAEIQCVSQASASDPGRGPTWTKTDFQCVTSGQLTQPTTTLRTTTTTTTTTVAPTQEPAEEFQPFLIIPGGSRRTTRRTTATTTSYMPIVLDITKTQPFQAPAVFPNYPRQPMVLPGNMQPVSVERVTFSPWTPPTRSVVRDWQDVQSVQTLQPTRKQQGPKIQFPPPITPTPVPQPFFIATTSTTTSAPAPAASSTEPSWMTTESPSGVCQIFQTCGEPPAVTNASPQPSYNGRHSCPGDYVRYVCEDGFRLDSLVSAVFCSQVTYSWSPQKPPACLRIRR